MSYPYQYSDGGRVSSKRPQQTNDCTVRALAIVTGSDYDIAYDYLKKRGRKSGQRFPFPNRAANDSALGYLLTWKPFPAVRGKARMNPVTFCYLYRKGRFILKTAKHVIAVIDGVIYDSFRSDEDRCIYGCWEVTEDER